MTMTTNLQLTFYHNTVFVMQVPKNY